MALTVSISVTTPTYTETGTSTLASSSCVTPAAPILQAVNPAFGPASGGSIVTLTGTGFVPNQTTVTIGSAQGQNVSVSPDGTSLTVNLPAGRQAPVQVSVTTPAGTSKQLPFEYRDPITTSGFLRDADTAAPLRGGLRDLASGGSLDNNQIAWVNGDGSWSFQSSSPGPFDIGFYARTDNNCNNAIGTSYVPSWYLGKPMAWRSGQGHARRRRDQVKAGSSTVACLSKAAAGVSCAAPAVLSGRVTVPGGGPAPYTCVFALGPSGEGQLSIADANGNWTATGLANDLQFIVGFIAGLRPAGPTVPVRRPTTDTARRCPATGLLPERLGRSRDSDRGRFADQRLRLGDRAWGATGSGELGQHRRVPEHGRRFRRATSRTV